MTRSPRLPFAAREAILVAMHAFIFGAAVIAIATIAYAVSGWLLGVVAVACAAWYGWHVYSHGHVPGADRDHLDQATRGDVKSALVAALVTAAAAIAIPLGLFATGYGYPVVYVALAVAALAGGFFYLKRR